MDDTNDTTKDQSVLEDKESPLSGSENMMDDSMESDLPADLQPSPPVSMTGQQTPTPTVSNPVQEDVTSDEDATATIEPESSSDDAKISLEDFRGKTISEILKEQGQIKDPQLEEVKYGVANKQGTEEEIIRNKGWVSEVDIVRAKAASYGIPFVDIGQEDISVETINKLPFETARAHNAVVFRDDTNLCHVGMADPLDIQSINYIRNVLGKPIRAYFASPQDVNTIIETRYAGRIEGEVTEAVEEVGEGIVQIDEGVQDISSMGDSIARAPVARIVNMILEYAVKFKASDVHIEPREKKVSVRFRIHGILAERLQLPTKLAPSVVSRVKILSDLKIDEHRVAQDGRFQIRVGKVEVDLRVSIMPTVYGEKVVIRLLEKGAAIRKLEKTGLRGSGFKLYREAVNSTQGIILVTGPTGSGKTQTLASSLMIINKPDVNIVTLEDPVEVKVDGVNQVQVNADVGLSFAKGLRAILRQDPDIIMVGEIRDQETATLAVQASLTGHLVLSTLHTNSASGALPRLLDMDVEPFLITSTVNVIVGQRLVRTICKHCKESYVAPQEIVTKIHKVLAGLQGFDMYSFPKNDNTLAQPGQVSTTDPTQIAPSEVAKQKQVQGNKEIKLYRGKGCNQCNNTGYSGRTGIFEVLKVSEKVSKLIMEHRSARSIEKQAQEEGMITMVQDGFMKALEGVTTIEEVLRVQHK